MLSKPSSLFDREVEWDDLTAFVTGPGSLLRLGAVHGRRRFGKSFLLRRLTDAVGGCYHLALEEAPVPAIARFAASVGRLYEPAAPLAFADWDQALRGALDLLGNRGSPQVLVIDEYPYLRAQSPELDSVVQSLVDAAVDGELGRAWTNPVSLIVCGSALSVMTELLSGTAALRGRATLDMAVDTFDFRQAREYWDISDLRTAFGLHSVVGGAAGYRDLTVSVPTPQNLVDLSEWVAATVLNPSHALFREDEYLLREDPRITKEAIYYSILGAVAAGRTSQAAIAAAVGKRSEDLTYHLNVLTSAGFVVRRDDLLVSRNPSHRVADPVVRFHELITRRYRDLLEDRKALEVWTLAQDTYRSQIVRPHFEEVCRGWAGRYADFNTLGGEIGPVRTIQVSDPAARQSFEIDVAATTISTVGRRQKTIQVLGEAKGSAVPLGIPVLERVERARQLLSERNGVSISPRAKLLLFGMAGFDDDLIRAARQRSDVELVDLDRLYQGT